MPRLSIALLPVLVLWGCQTKSDQPVKAIIGAALTNGRGGAPLADSVVVVDGSRIRAAGPRASVPIPQESERVNGAGKTIAPAREGGVIAPGEPADFLVLDADGKIEMSMKGGRWGPLPVQVAKPQLRP